MSVKTVLVLCAQALWIQCALSQCAGRANLEAGQASYGLSSQIAPGLGGSACGGPALGLGYNGLGYGNSIGNGLACGAGLGYGAGLGNGLGYGAGLGNGLGYGNNLAIEVIPTSGGALPVTSSSANAPTGLIISSENVFDGSLLVSGELPFLSAVALEGTLSSGGAAGVSYSCGNGVTAIENIAPSAAYGSGAIGYGSGALGYGSGAIGYGSGAGYALGAGAYSPGLAGIAPLSISSAGCNGGYAPVAEIVAPIGGCGCGGYQDGIYY